MVKLKEPLYAVPPGEVYPRWYAAGERVDGRLEEVAREMKIADVPRRRPANAVS